MPRIDFYSEFKLFVKIKLGDGEVLLGRGTDCQIQLPRDRVSRNHAKITSAPDGDGYVIENMSVNGTRLNSKMLEDPAPLMPGDRIYIADYTIIYQGDDAPSEKLDGETTVLG